MWILILTVWGRWLLTRTWLPLHGHLPWAVMAFLQDAHRRGVLRQAGGVYQFRHARLQNHLATAYGRMGSDAVSAQAGRTGYLTGLRPSPTRHAVAGWGRRAPVGGI